MSKGEIQQSAASQQSDTDAELAAAAASGAASKALRAGAKAPIFTLTDVSGRQVALEDLLNAGPVVLHFFRGTWCSFGEASLTDFSATYQEVIALGASAIAIAPPCKVSPQSSSSPIRELQDIDMKVARAYGLAFDLPVGLRARYEGLGYVPPPTRKANTWLVPLPATYLLDRDGTVVLAFIDVDYRKHFESGSLLSALKALQARHAMLRRPMRS